MNLNLNIIITGTAGFIGYSLALELLKNQHSIIGIDNHNTYYDVNLKEARVSNLKCYESYKHLKIDLIEKEKILEIFKIYKPDYVVNLAAQAGVRYSIENPLSYIDSNIKGFANILEGCRHNNVKHLIYASSSSVYGANTKLPFSVNQTVDHPLSLYAATKKSNELMAHAYSNLYKLPTTGLRFFTVYGPWGRPDMALFKFTKNIIENKTIDVYNNGLHKRDFTYISDIVDGIMKIIMRPAEPNPYWNSNEPDPGTSSSPWRIFNIGNSQPRSLMEYIAEIEKNLNKKAKINFLPLQPGDVYETHANIDNLIKDYSYMPKVNIQEGIYNFIDWYKNFYC